MLAFLKAHRVHGFIFGGDQLDNAAISPHNRDKALYRYEPGAYQQATKNMDALLSQVEKVLPADAKRIWIVGNHDDWERQFIEREPCLDGILDRTKELRLAERGWKIVPQGQAYQLGKLVVIHGDTLSGPGQFPSKFPTKKALETYAGHSVLFGHTHQAQSTSKVSPVFAHDRHMAWSAPAMCELNPAYLRNRPTAWSNGFVLIETRTDGTFNVFPIIVSNGQFSYAGRTYGRPAA